jgi:hypothetical protein
LHSTEGAIGFCLVRVSNVRLGLCVVSSMSTSKLNCIVLSHWSLTSFTFDTVSARALVCILVPNIFCREISVDMSLPSFHVIIHGTGRAFGTMWNVNGVMLVRLRRGLLCCIEGRCCWSIDGIHGLRYGSLIPTWYSLPPHISVASNSV